MYMYLPGPGLPNPNDLRYSRPDVPSAPSKSLRISPEILHSEHYYTYVHPEVQDHWVNYYVHVVAVNLRTAYIRILLIERKNKCFSGLAVMISV